MDFKDCPVCKQRLPVSDFHKDKRKTDGLDWRCKNCKREGVNASKRRKRENEYYAQNKEGRADKTKARSAARKRWNSIKPNTCAVMGCTNSDIELAHLDYNFELDVVPLCKHHHRMLDK